MRFDLELPPGGHHSRGFTLLELLASMMIIGLLTSIAVPRVHDLTDRARVAQAIGDIRAIQADLAGQDSLPLDLAAIGWGNRLDPWGHPYVYLRMNLSGGGAGGSSAGGGGGGGGAGGGGGGGGSTQGAARKDKFLVPLNSDYDLYSMGSDGASSPPLTAAASADDVIRANNGSFIGLASRY